MSPKEKDDHKRERERKRKKETTTVKPEKAWDLLTAAARRHGLSLNPVYLRKLLLLRRSLTSLPGTILLGPPSSFKSSALRVVQSTLRAGEGWGPQSEYCQVRSETVFPSAHSRRELFGFMDADTKRWHDGVISTALRAMGERGREREWEERKEERESDGERHDAREGEGERERNEALASSTHLPTSYPTLLHLDGPIRSYWADALLPCLSPSNPSCFLSSGEVLSLPSTSRFVFETTSLSHASPSLLAATSLVHFETAVLTMRDMKEAWLRGLPPMLQKRRELLGMLFDRVFLPLWGFRALGSERGQRGEASAVSVGRGKGCMQRDKVLVGIEEEKASPSFRSPLSTEFPPPSPPSLSLSLSPLLIRRFQTFTRIFGALIDDFRTASESELKRRMAQGVTVRTAQFIGKLRRKQSESHSSLSPLSSLKHPEGANGESANNELSAQNERSTNNKGREENAPQGLQEAEGGPKEQSAGARPQRAKRRARGMRRQRRISAFHINQLRRPTAHAYAEKRVRKQIEYATLFATVWSLCGPLGSRERTLFEHTFRALQQKLVRDRDLLCMSFPKGVSIFHTHFSFVKNGWDRWENKGFGYQPLVSPLLAQSNAAATATTSTELSVTATAGRRSGAAGEIGGRLGDASGVRKGLKKASALPRPHPDTRHDELIVGTLEHRRLTALLSLLTTHDYPVLLMGPSGVGKSSVLASVVQRLRKRDLSGGVLVKCHPTCSRETFRAQIERHLRGERLGLSVPMNHKEAITVFLDDVNQVVASEGCGEWKREAEIGLDGSLNVNDGGGLLREWEREREGGGGTLRLEFFRQMAERKGWTSPHNFHFLFEEVKGLRMAASISARVSSSLSPTARHGVGKTSGALLHLLHRFTPFLFPGYRREQLTFILREVLSHRIVARELEEPLGGTLIQSIAACVVEFARGVGRVVCER